VLRSVLCACVILLCGQTSRPASRTHTLAAWHVGRVDLTTIINMMQHCCVRLEVAELVKCFVSHFLNIWSILDFSAIVYCELTVYITKDKGDRLIQCFNSVVLLCLHDPLSAMCRFENTWSNCLV
jgi:hypothetical protein